MPSEVPSDTVDRPRPRWTQTSHQAADSDSEAQRNTLRQLWAEKFNRAAPIIGAAASRGAGPEPRAEQSGVRVLLGVGLSSQEPNLKLKPAPV